MKLLIVGLAMVMTIWSPEASAKSTGGQVGDEERPGEMTNALNYLAELDKYYSNVARPRYNNLDFAASNSHNPKLLGYHVFNLWMNRERRVNQNLSSALEKLSAIKNYYTEMGRSRHSSHFDLYPITLGKRSWDPYTLLMGKRPSNNNAERSRREQQHDDRFLKIQNIDSQLQQMSRPRFGKRSYPEVPRSPYQVLFPAYEQWE